MSERHGYEPGVPCWVDTWQPDADAAVRFYNELFGWEAEDTMPADVPGKHYICRLRGRDVAAVASRPEAAPAETAWGTYVWVANVEEAATKAVEAGGGVVMQPFHSLDGGRIALVTHPAGGTIGVWQPGTHKGAEVVDEPGAWAMSQLRTPDPEGAGAFYGALFGWEPEPFGADVTLWRLPGFVGGEPEQPVPRDVVAAMASADGQPRWSVDFWIGSTAVLADPQGARFTVSAVGQAAA